MDEQARPRPIVQAALHTLEALVGHPDPHQDDRAEQRPERASVEPIRYRAERVLRMVAGDTTCLIDSIRWTTVVSGIAPDTPTSVAVPVELLADPAFRLGEDGQLSSTIDIHIDLTREPDEVLVYGAGDRRRIFVPPDDIALGAAAETYRQLRADGATPVVAADVARTIGRDR